MPCFQGSGGKSALLMCASRPTPATLVFLSFNLSSNCRNTWLPKFSEYNENYNNHIAAMSFLKLSHASNLHQSLFFSEVEIKWFWNLKVTLAFFTILVSYKSGGGREAKSFEEVKDI